MLAATHTFAALGRAAMKAAQDRLRRLGFTGEHGDWATRAAICERCPMRVVRCGTSYCGRPFASQIVRDPVVDGCGCPTIAKAKDPDEHCPVDRSFSAAHTEAGHCTCRWCSAAELGRASI